GWRGATAGLGHRLRLRRGRGPPGRSRLDGPRAAPGPPPPAEPAPSGPGAPTRATPPPSGGRPPPPAPPTPAGRRPGDAATRSGAGGSRRGCRSTTPARTGRFG